MTTGDRDGPIRVLLADDQALVRAGLRMIVDAAPDLRVVGEAGTGREAVAMAADAEVVLMDIRMPDLDGLTATRMITADDRLTGTRVLVLTTFEIEEYVLEALRAGAGGFLGKGAEPEEVRSAIRTIARGDALLSPAATGALIRRFLDRPEPSPVPGPPPALLVSLTDREREVVGLVARGLSNDDIARDLVVSSATVKTHVNRAMAKLGTRSRAQLVVVAFQGGLGAPG